ncbi:MAG: hypothetical protein Fur0037_08210 [Planctomycetota bacterium]
MTARHHIAGPRVLTSRIGLRIIALCVACVLLPVMAFAWFAMVEVSDHLNADAEETLHRSAKFAGMNVAASIDNLVTDLALARSALLDPTPDPGSGPEDLAAGFLESFRSLVAIERGRTWRALGERDDDIAPPNADEARHLSSGRPLLRVRTRRGEPPRVSLLTSDADGVLLAGVIRVEKLFDVENLRSNGAEVMVLSNDLAYIHGSVPQGTDTSSLGEALAANPSSGSLEWTLDGVPHVAYYWRMFLRPQYGTDLIVVQSRDRESVYAPLRDFRWLFAWSSALALILMTATALTQLRRTLNPIANLTRATRELAEGNLETSVPVEGRDEFGELAVSFNRMTGQLREQIRRREETERALIAARDEALAAARAKAEFLTNVSHELRTPLTSILAYSELLLRFPNEDEAERREFLAVISEQSARLNTLIDRVLDLSASHAWTMGKVLVEETLREAVSMLPEGPRARIRLELAPGLQPIHGNHERLVQLWGLLIDNACKFSPEREPVIVRAGVLREITVSVTDRGGGISREDQDRIFTPFSQVGRDILTEKAQGVGLGLTLARNIAEKHGGRIWVESEPGRGSTFSVALPIGRPEDLEAPAPVLTTAI